MTHYVQKEIKEILDYLEIENKPYYITHTLYFLDKITVWSLITHIN